MSAETNAERLRRFKDEWLGDGDELEGEDIDFLIEQAEETQNFKNLHKSYLNRYTVVVGEMNNLAEENARLRKALAFYADEGNYVLWNGMAMSQKEIERDKGKKAKTALEGEG